MESYDISICSAFKMLTHVQDKNFLIRKRVTEVTIGLRKMAYTINRILVHYRDNGKLSLNGKMTKG